MLNNLYDLLTGDEDARVCKDIPERLCEHQPRNFFAHMAAQSLTKIGDELANPKTTLAWLITAVGAPAALIAWLVPIRESLSLLPQLAVARAIRQVAVRKWFWVVGSVLQGVFLAAMAASAWLTDGWVAGALIIGFLVLFSLARGICSVAAKDVLGKTVSKERRGAVSGYAASVAGVVAVCLGLWLGSDAAARADSLLLLLLLASGLWWLAALAYARVAESPGATEGGGNALSVALQSLRLAWREPQLRLFLITRTLLLASPLAAPLLVSLAQQSGDGALSLLGALIVVSGLASALSGAVWGRLADRSSRKVMMGAGATAALACLLAPFLNQFSGSLAQWSLVGLFFVLAVAHAGIRLGRKTYLVDMADADNRATYTAVSNTVIGVLLLATGGVVGLLTALLGAAWAVLVLGLLALAAVMSAWRLPEID